MNTNRQLLWGITLSLLAHGVVFGLPFSPGRQRPILTHRPLSLEISLVKVKAQEDAPPKKKPPAQIESPKFRKPLRTKEKRVAQPQMNPASKTKAERLRKHPRVKGKKVTEKRKREKSSPIAEKKPIPSSREIPATPPVKGEPPTPKPEPPSPFAQRKTAAAAPELLEKGAEKAAATSVEKPEEGDDLKASLSPDEEDSPRSRRITLARPKYDHAVSPWRGRNMIKTPSLHTPGSPDGGVMRVSWC
jgi:hypothetical protein